MDYFDRELMDVLAPAVERRVGYAVARNVPDIVKDLERGIRESTGMQNEMPVTVKLKFIGVNQRSIMVEIESIGWVRKVTHADKDFERLQVDLAQPELPGFGDALVTPEFRYDDGSEDMKSITDFARRYGKRILRIRNILDKNCRIVQAWCKDHWRNVLQESVNDVNLLLAALADDGGIAFDWQGLMLPASRDVVQNAGGVLYDREDGKCRTLGEDRVGDVIPLEGVCVRLPRRPGGGPDSPCAEVEDADTEFDLDDLDAAQGDEPEQADDIQADDVEHGEDAQGDEPEQAVDVQGVDDEQEGDAQTDGMYGTDYAVIVRERNAAKLHAKGLRVACIDADGKTVMTCDMPASHPFSWRKETFPTKKRASEEFKALRAGGAIDPLAPSGAAMEAGFTIIRGQKISGGGCTIKQSTRNGGWDNIGEYDTTKSSQAAYDDMVKDPTVLEG